MFIVANFIDYGYDGGDRLNAVSIAHTLQGAKDNADRVTLSNVDEQRIYRVNDSDVASFDLDDLTPVVKRAVRYESEGGSYVPDEWSDEHVHRWEWIEQDVSAEFRAAGIHRCRCGKWAMPSTHAVGPDGVSLTFSGFEEIPIPTLIEGPVEVSRREEDGKVVVTFARDVQIVWGEGRTKIVGIGEIEERIRDEAKDAMHDSLTRIIDGVTKP